MRCPTPFSAVDRTSRAIAGATCLSGGAGASRYTMPLMPETDTAPPDPRGDWRNGLHTDAVFAGELPFPIRAVEFDSRAAEPGDVFVCIVGERADGHDYAAQALAAGAVALVAQAGRGEGLEALGEPVVRVPDTRPALSSIAAAHEGYPARRLSVIGITGTVGKSTTAFLTLAAIEGAGRRA